MNKQRFSTRQLTLCAMLCAIAYVVMLVGRVSLMAAAPFLKYDPKDVIIAIGGFLMGPFPALLITLVVSFLEMLTASSTGWWGFLMNVLSTAAFVVPAAVIYSHKQSLKRAGLGLAVGVVAMTVLMVAWNYIVTPIYMGYPRAAVAAMLPTVFFPFNLIKGVLNAAITLLLYKPCANALRRTNLLPKSNSTAKRRFNPTATVIAAVLVITVALVIVCFPGTFKVVVSIFSHS
ncbi:MAG: ECF transporter S component [Clostridia bacterium]|nr:ECF transporter S component [Clostridia bacterium]